MKLDKVLFFFGLDCAHVQKTIVVYCYLRNKPLKRGGYVIYTLCMNTKHNIVHGRGPFNI